LVLGAALCVAVPAAAQQDDDATRSAARALGTSGVDAYQDGHYDKASDELEKAYSLLPVPSLALWSGRALVKRGLWVEAAQRFQEAASLQVPAGDAIVQRKAMDEARSELATLRPRIPTLELKLVGAQPEEVQVTVDGQEVASSLLGSPRLVNPGKHQITATRGADHAVADEAAAEGQHRVVELRFSSGASATIVGATREKAAESPSAAGSGSDRVSPSHSNTQKTLGIVALAAGGAGLVLGGVTGVLAINKKAELDDTGQCEGGCPVSLQSDVDALHRFRTISTIGFVAGGVLAATGVVLWATAPSPSGAEAHAMLTPGGVALGGKF
jgi:hypothetical protein